jgi:phosphomannomutase
MSTNPIKFGTDGWRAVIARDFTFENVQVCSQGLAEYLVEEKLDKGGVVIGYDTRFASEDFAAAAAEVMAANAIKVYLSPKAIPTPEVSFGVTAKKAGAGIVITASHNPARYNGFKLKSAVGASAPAEMIGAVSRNIARIFESKKIRQMPLETAVRQGLVEYMNFDPLYLARMADFVDLGRIRNSGLKIIADSMFGAGCGYFKSLLSGGSAQVIEMNQERNPSFPEINPEPITPNLNKLSSRIREQGASVGLATDGDADRIGIMDENGKFITQLEVYALLALYLLEVRKQKGAIVKTVTATSMLYSLGEMFGVPVIETPVGFKYVAPVMLEKNALIGGEESGGYGFRGHVPERDAVLAALYFLDFMVSTGKSPAQLLQYLFSKVGPHYYDRQDYHLPQSQCEPLINRLMHSQPQTIDGVKVDKFDTVDGFRFTLVDKSWLLIRLSGTEPLMRIYAETDSPERVNRILAFGKKLAGV